MTNSLPWKDPPIFKFGKQSINMGHLYHGYVKSPEGKWLLYGDYFKKNGGCSGDCNSEKMLK